MKRGYLLSTIALFILSSCDFGLGGNSISPSDFPSSEPESSLVDPASSSTDPNSSSEPNSTEVPSTSETSSTLPDLPKEELGEELLKNSDFNSLDSWIIDNDYCLLNINSHHNGTIIMDVNNYEADEVWKPQFIQRDISLVSMHQYRISFTIQSSMDRLVMVRLQANDYSTMLIEKTISLSSNVPYTFEEDITVLNTTNYLFGFMLGRINNQVLESVHTITISNPSIKEVYKKDSETPDSPIKNRSLAWSDEFNGTSIDNTKWSYEIGTGSWGWGNNEQQYYTNSKDNSYVSDGTLKIVARKETMYSSNYTSARMITKNKYSFKYGYVEARIALPSSMGIWPAFWMLGTNIDQVGWPACGEIDIMEAVNNNNTVYSTIHYKNATGHEEYGQNFNVADRTSFHTYGFEWTETKLSGYVDNIKIFETNNDGYKANSFNNELYILLNVAVGGQWPGYNIADNFPQVMTVDYVRVYQ